jgi:hypothetical protein
MALFLLRPYVVHVFKYLRKEQGLEDQISRSYRALRREAGAKALVSEALYGCEYGHAKSIKYVVVTLEVAVSAYVWTPKARMLDYIPWDGIM